MIFQVAAVFLSPVHKDRQKTDIVFLILGDDAVIEEAVNHQDVIAVLELDEGHLGVGINESLLVGSANSLDST